jgi:hypothetical protein
MRVSLFRFSLLFCLALFASVSASPGGEPAKPVAPAPVKPTSAVNPRGLKKIESDLFKPFQGLTTDSSLDAVLSQPQQAPAPAVPSKRARELEERRKNWIFLDPDEMLRSPRGEELGLTESQKAERESTRLSPMEDFLTRSSNKQAKTAKKSDKSDPFGLRDPFSSKTEDAEGTEKSPASMTDAERRMDSIFGRDSKSATPNSAGEKSKRTFADIFGVGSSEPSRKEIEDQKARLDAFRNMIGASTKTQSPESLSPVGGLSDFAPKPAVTPSLPSALPSIPRTSGSDGQFGSVPGLPHIGVLEDQNAKALMVPGVTPPPPKTESPKSYFSTTPSFTAPKRVF